MLSGAAAGSGLSEAADFLSAKAFPGLEIKLDVTRRTYFPDIFLGKLDIFGT